MGYKGTNQVFEKLLMKSYGIKGAEKNLMSDALKANKKATIRKRNTKNEFEKEKTVFHTKEVVKVEDKDKEEDIDDEMIIATSRKQKEAGSLKPTKSVGTQNEGYWRKESYFNQEKKGRGDQGI
ncbi:hypothetical protein FXO37_29284 [Capsicum annuum]|nr:hypothetical protein FXO37_29284 [Capsicum annuum]